MINRVVKLTVNKTFARSFNSTAYASNYQLPSNPSWSIKELNLTRELKEDEKINSSQLEKLYKLSNLQFPSETTSQLEMISGCEELIRLVGNVKELNLKGVDSLSRLEIVQELDLDLASEEADSPLEKDSTWALDQSPSRRENYFITKSV